MAEQYARGLWGRFAPSEQPFAEPNGMEDNIRWLDDHLGLYTLLAPASPEAPEPTNPAPGDGQIFTDGTYAVFNLGEWRSYSPRKGLRAVLASGTEHWMNTGTSWAQYSVLDTTPATQQAQAFAERAETAQALSQAAAVSLAVALAAKDTIAIGRASVADGVPFWVRPNETDGLTRFTWFLRTSGTTQTFLASLLQGSEWDAQFELLDDEPALSGWTMVEVDAEGLVVGGITANGDRISNLLYTSTRVSSSGNVDAAKDVTAGEAVRTPLLDIGGVGQFQIDEDGGQSGWIAVELDADGLILRGITSAWEWVDYMPAAWAGPASQTPAPSARYVIDASLGATVAVYTSAVGKNIDVLAETLATGAVVKLTDGGRNTRPRLTADGSRVVYTREADGALMSVPVGGGARIRAFPDRRMVFWGHSMASGYGTTGWGTTYAGAPPQRLQALMGKRVVNRGTNSLTARQIAARMGAMVQTVTVSGGSIPASGQVNVTLTPDDLLSQYTNITQYGSLAGVPGTLQRLTTGGQVVFIRDIAGDAVPVAGGTPFVVDRAGRGMYADAIAVTDDLGELITIIWACYNSKGDPAGNRAAVNAMVANLKAWKKKYLVLSDLPGDPDRNTSGGSKVNYDNLILGNSYLAADHGDRYVDLIAPLQAANDGSATDLADVSQGIVPASMRSAITATPPALRDPVHPGDAGAVVVVNTVLSRLTQLGWQF